MLSEVPGVKMYWSVRGEDVQQVKGWAGWDATGVGN